VPAAERVHGWPCGATPQSACSASTTGPSDHSGKRVTIFPLDSHFSFAGLIHGIEIGLERDLLCCVLEGLISEPDAMPLFPNRTDVPPAMAQ